MDAELSGDYDITVDWNGYKVNLEFTPGPEPKFRGTMWVFDWGPWDHCCVVFDTIELDGDGVRLRGGGSILEMRDDNGSFARAIEEMQDPALKEWLGRVT